MEGLTNEAAFDCTVAVISKIIENYILTKPERSDFIEKMNIMMAVLRGFEDDSN